MVMVLGMIFLTFTNADIQFLKKKLTSKTYTITKALLITQMVELINKKEFAKAVFEENIKAFMVYISFLSSKSRITIPQTK